jgi:hypothetical protein
MKLQPPKPPKTAGTVKVVKKKSKASTNGAALKEASGKKSEKTQKTKEKTAVATKLEDEISELPPELPLIDSSIDTSINSPVNDANDALTDGSASKTEPENSLDQKLSQLDVPPVPVTSSAEKKEGFFSRLFKKKENDAKNDTKAATTDASLINSDLDNLSNSLGDMNDNSEVPESISSADDDGVVFAESEKSVSESNAADKSKNLSNSALDDELPSITDDSSKNKNYEKIATKYISKTEKSSAKDSEISSSDEWTNDMSVDSLIKSSSNDTKRAKKDKKRKEKESQNSQSSDWVAPLEVKKEAEKQSDEVTETPEIPDFSASVDEWKSKSSAVALATKEKPSNKEIKQIDSRLKKLLKTYDGKIIKLAASRKKEIESEISRIGKKEAELNKKMSELDKKEKSVATKAQKLSDLEKSINQRKSELDELVSKEDSLTKRKEIMEKNIAADKLTLSGLKTEIANNQKAFDTLQKNISSEKKNLQDDLKKSKAMVEAEKSKGEKKLAELAKKVEEVEAHLENMQKREKMAAASRKNKEAELREKEKEINSLIMQEKKIISLLKNNELQSVEYDSLISRRSGMQTQVPKTIIGDDGEPEIYVDDEDTLNQKIKDCKDLIKEANYDDAKMLYNEIREDFMSANLDEKAKKTIKHEIRELYDEICLKLISSKK